MKTKTFKALLGIIPSLVQHLSDTKKSGNDTMTSIFKSSFENSNYSNAALPQNSFKVKPEMIKALAEKTDNSRDMIIILSTVARLENA